MPYGFKLPFAVSTGSVGYLDTSNTELEAAGNNIKSLLVTNWGERVGHYGMGCNFIEFIFEPARDETLKAKISDRVFSQLARWLPYVAVDDIRVVFADETNRLPENTLRVGLAFRLTSRPDLSPSFISVDVTP